MLQMFINSVQPSWREQWRRWQLRNLQEDRKLPKDVLGACLPKGVLDSRDQRFFA